MPKFLEPCRQEFQLRNCGFGNAPPDEMVRSQWQSRTKNAYFLVYRWLVAIFYITTVSVSMSHIETWRAFGLYFIYLTDWGVLLCMATAIFGAVLVSIWYYHPEYSAKITSATEMPLSFKWYWAIHNATMTLSFVISIIYWGILHKSTMPVNATNVLTHACNSAIMFLDVLIVAHPIRLYHVYQPLAVGLVYLIFSIFYFLVGGTDKDGNPFIYIVLDWTKTTGAITTSVGTLVLAVIVHTVLLVVQKLRVLVANRCAGKTISTVSPRTTSSLASTANAITTGGKESIGGSGGGGQTHISMVLGSGYSNAGFKGSSNNVV